MHGETHIADHLGGSSMALPNKAAPSASRPEGRSAMQWECARPAARTSFCTCICFACCCCGALMAVRGGGGDGSAPRRRRYEFECGQKNGVECSATEPGAAAGQGGRESGGLAQIAGSSSRCGRQLHEPARRCLFLRLILPSIMEPSGAGGLGRINAPRSGGVRLRRRFAATPVRCVSLPACATAACRSVVSAVRASHVSPLLLLSGGSDSVSTQTTEGRRVWRGSRFGSRSAAEGEALPAARIPPDRIESPTLEVLPPPPPPPQLGVSFILAMWSQHAVRCGCCPTRVIVSTSLSAVHGGDDAEPQTARAGRRLECGRMVGTAHQCAQIHSSAERRERVVMAGREGHTRSDT